MSDSREAFEAWLYEGGLHVNRLVDVESKVHASWLGWQARDAEVARLREALEMVAAKSQLSLDTPWFRIDEETCDKVRNALAANPTSERVTLDQVEQVFIDHKLPHDMDAIRALHELSQRKGGR